MISKKSRSIGFALASSAALMGAALPGCSRDTDNYTTPQSREVASSSIPTPTSSVYSDFFIKSERLDKALVTFLNSLRSSIGNASYFYSSDKESFEESREAIKDMEDHIIHLLLTQKEMPHADRNLLVEYSEALGEGRGAIFDARSSALYYGEVQFSGEGLNELHGLRSQTQALRAVFSHPAAPVTR